MAVPAFPSQASGVWTTSLALPDSSRQNWESQLTTQTELRPAAPDPATSSHVTVPAEATHPRCVMPQFLSQKITGIIKGWWFDATQLWRGPLRSSEEKECSTISLRMNFGLVNSLSPLTFRGVSLGGKGSVFKSYVFKEQVICIFAYDIKSKNENTVWIIQVINLSNYSPHFDSEFRAPAAWLRCLPPQSSSLSVPPTQALLISGTPWLFLEWTHCYCSICISFPLFTCLHNSI